MVVKHIMTVTSSSQFLEKEVKEPSRSIEKETISLADYSTVEQGVRVAAADQQCRALKTY